MFPDRHHKRLGNGWKNGIQPAAITHRDGDHGARADSGGNAEDTIAAVGYGEYESRGTADGDGAEVEY